MRYTIKDLTNGLINIKHDGSLEQLKTVLKTAFPKDLTTPSGSDTIYGNSINFKNNWARSTGIKSSNPIVSCIDLYEQLNLSEKEETNPDFFPIF